MRLVYHILILFLLASCYRRHLYVQQEWVDRNFLASSHVGTPDPRQENPPEGQRLLIAWDFPRSLYQQVDHLKVSVRLWNETEDVQCLAMPRKRGYAALFFSNERILTYLVQVISKERKVLETWKHHFWTEWIEIGESSVSAPSP